MTDIDEIREVVEAAQDKKVFSLIEAIKGRAYPTEDVEVYLNADAGYQLGEVNALLTTLAQASKQDTEEYDHLDKVAHQLGAEVLATALTFHLRGVAPGHIAEVQKKVDKQAETEEWDEGTYNLKRAAAWIAPHIVKVTDADGSEDEHVYTMEEVEDLMYFLPDSEWSKIDRAVANLSFNSAYFDQATDAGFLQKS